MTDKSVSEMSDEELRGKVIQKGKQIGDTGTNNLTDTQLKNIAGKLRMKQVSKEFQLQCMRDLDDSKMPIGDFLATMLHGNWQDYGEAKEEVEAAKELIRDWSRHYLKARNIANFLNRT